MNTNKQFFVTLEYHCDFEPQYDFNKEVGTAFKSFDKAVDFAEAVMKNTQTYLTKVVNYSVCYK